jgi:hypothetical protein
MLEVRGRPSAMFLPELAYFGFRMTIGVNIKKIESNLIEI